MRVFLLNEINKYDSVGINLLSAVLKRHGHQSRVFLVPDLIENTTISIPWLRAFKFAYYISDEAYVDFLLSFKPDVIGFSVVTSYWRRASRLAKLIKEKKPDIFTIAGGPHPTLSLYEDMFNQTGFDYICRGDGEIVLPQLLDALEQRTYDPQITGVYYFRHNQIKGEGIGPVVHDLDTLPFQDKSDVFRDYPFIQKTYSINTQRSCQYSCSYCGSPEYRKIYAAFNEPIFRRRSVDNVIKELSVAKKRYPRMRHVGFFDDTFTTGRQWIRDFVREYKKYIGLPYFMCTNPCLLQDEELILQLKSSGLIYVEIGVQAIDEDFRLNKVKRPDRDDHIFRTGRLLRKHNIYFQANHIFGLDMRDFTDEDFLQDTVEYYIKLNPNRTHCFQLEYLPGSEEARKALAENRITKEEYQKILKGESSVSYNFGGSIGKEKKKFVPYLVLLELLPFIPRSWVRSILHNKIFFRLVKLIPFNYIILARLLNTLKDKRDIEGSPHYGKYIDGAKYILQIKQCLRRSKKMNTNWYLGLLSGIARVKFARQPVPLMCHWEITYRCNLKCVFCSSRFADKMWQPETTTQEALDILSQLAKMGTKILNLSGGEPTRRNDLPQIIRQAHSLGIKVSITTNGVMEEERRYWLLDADVARVSLEGTPLLNSELRRSGSGVDSATEAIKTLKFLRKHGKHPLIASTYSAKTGKEDVEFLVRLARELKIKIVFTPLAIGFSDKRENFTPQDRKERRERLADTLLPLGVSLKRIEAFKQRYPDCISPAEPSFSILKRGGLEKFGCLAMNTAICLKPDGAVAIPCIEFPEDVLKSNDLFSIFYGERAEQARKKQGKYWFCEQCQLMCMVSSTSLVKLAPLFYLTRQYLPQVLVDVLKG